MLLLPFHDMEKALMMLKGSIPMKTITFSTIPPIDQPSPSKRHTSTSPLMIIIVMIFAHSGLIQCSRPITVQVNGEYSNHDQVINGDTHRLQVQNMAPLVPTLLVFGDSTVDVGNNNHLITISRSNFHPYGRDLIGAKEPTGRFSNGMLVTDYIASMVGLHSTTVAYLDTSSRGHGFLRGKKVGISFASASSGFYDSTAKHFNALPLSKQLEHFKEYRQSLITELGHDNATKILGKAMYILSTGTNDFLNNYFFNIYLRTRYTVPQFQALLLSLCSQFIQDLYHLGARRIGVVTLPPLGCLPAEITIYRASGCVEHLNDLAILFNKDLKAMMSSLKLHLIDVKLAYMDSYNVLMDAIKYPTKYGFKQARKACCGSGKLEVGLFCNKLTVGTCKDASSFIFWDSFHPTERMNQILATNLFKATWMELGIEEPYAYYCKHVLHEVLQQPKKQIKLTNKWRWKVFFIGWILFFVSLLKRIFPKMISLGI